MLDKVYGSPLHELADLAQRVIGVAALSPDSIVLAQVLGADPSPDVRVAATVRGSDRYALAAALRAETLPRVRDDQIADAVDVAFELVALADGANTRGCA